MNGLCALKLRLKSNFETGIALINGSSTFTENQYHSPGKQALWK